MKLSKRMLRKIIKENVEDLGVDQSVNIPTKIVPGRSMSDPGKYAWASTDVRRGYKDESTYDIDKDEMHIFDFDDTLGEGFGPTLVAAAIMHGGVLRPVMNFVAILKALNVAALSREEAKELKKETNKRNK